MKQEILNRHTNNSPKINEYIQRYGNGESMESFGDIPESWKELIEKGTLVNEQKENDVDLSAYPMIPSKWQCLISQPDLLEEMWTFAIPIDEKEYETLKAWKKRGVDYAKAQVEKGEKVPELGTKEVTLPEATPSESEIFGTGIEREIKLPSLERKQTIHAIGDLNGSYKSFIDHLKSQNLISIEQGDLVWVGGNSKAIFIGDILGDRSPDGMRIYERLQELQNQAKLQGGTIEWLSGNHENMFNAILCGFSTEKGKKVEEDMSYRMSGYTGNLELLKLLPIESLQDLYTTIVKEKDTVFGSDYEAYIQKKKRTLQSAENNPETLTETVAAYKKGYEELLNKKNYLDSFCSLVESQNYEEAQKSLFTFIDTLDKKYQNQIGKIIIENRSLLKENINDKEEYTLFKEALLSQKLITIHDDSLYTHTSLTPRMVQIIQDFSKDVSIKEGIENINTFYQKVLKICLENDPPAKILAKLTEEETKYFNILRDEFISTSSYSRENFSESNTLTDQEKLDFKDFLKKEGVNIGIHGHTNEQGQPKGFDDLPLISIDRGVYNSEGVNIEKPLAYSTISQDGIASLPE